MQITENIYILVAFKKSKKKNLNCILNNQSNSQPIDLSLQLLLTHEFWFTPSISTSKIMVKLSPFPLFQLV